MEIKFYIIKCTLSRIYFFSQKIYTKGLILFHISFIGGHLVAQDQTYNYVPQTIAFGSCNDTKKDQSIWRVIDETQKDLWIWLGDNIYWSGKDLTELETLYNDQKSNPFYNNIERTTEVVGIWDDHDYGRNDDGISNPLKVESKNLYMDFFKIPTTHPMRKRHGIYHSIGYKNDLFQLLIILLDTRSFKPDYLKDNESISRYKVDKTGDILGQEQWNWLEENLKNASQYNAVIFCSGIQFISSEHPFEKWQNYPKSKSKLISLLNFYDIRNPIFLTGDRHIAEISKLAINNKTNLYDFTSSGLTHSYDNYNGEENKSRISPVISDKNFGIISFNFNFKSYELHIKNIKGKSVYKIKNTLND